MDPKYPLALLRAPISSNRGQRRESALLVGAAAIPVVITIPRPAVVPPAIPPTIPTAIPANRVLVVRLTVSALKAITERVAVITLRTKELAISDQSATIDIAILEVHSQASLRIKATISLTELKPVSTGNFAYSIIINAVVSYHPDRI